MDQPSLIVLVQVQSWVVWRWGFAAGFGVLVTSCSSFEASPSHGDGGAPDGGDGGVPAASDWTSFNCAAKGHALCDDMNDGDLGKSPPWTPGANPRNAERCSYTDDLYVSPPRALRMTSSATPAKSPSLVARLEATISKLTCDLDVRIEAAPENTTMSLLDVVLSEGGAGGFGFSVLDQSGSGVLVHTQSYPPVAGDVTSHVEFLDSSTLPLGRWVHVHFDVSPTDPDARLALSFGDSPPRRIVGGRAAQGPASEATLTISLSGGAEGWSALFDNVVCDLE
ncbi:MAG: hypothetical protein U0270_25065 [Labilithrix sp.]